MAKVTVCVFRNFESADMASLWRQILEPPDPDEIWRTLPGDPWLHVSNRGDIYRDDFWAGNWARALRVRLDRGGYPRISHKGIWRPVHQLVLETFAGPCPPGELARHLNDIKTDNRWPENLCWGTPAENSADAVRNGNHPNAAKTHCPADHPYDDANTYVRPGGQRACRACRAAGMRRASIARRGASRFCAGCGELFAPSKSNHEYCSKACKQRGYWRRHHKR